MVVSEILQTYTHMQASFGSIHSFVNCVAEHARSDCQVLLVGNKMDLTDERTVSEEEAKV